MIDLFKSKFFYFLLVLILLPIQITLGVYLYFAPEIPSSSEVASVELQVPLKIFTKDGKLIGEFGEIHRTKLKFEEIPDTFVKAFLAAEDSDYFNHTGVDILSLVRAAYQFLREGEIVSGGGTITMQVARNYVLTKERTFERKLKEIFTALKIDFSFTKEEIFELYVNQIFLGNRAYGIKAAAEIYYDKNLEDLNLAQYAMIAALPKAPSRINPLINPRKAINRRNYVLRRMLALEFIDQAQFDVASSAPVTASFSGISPEVEADYLAEEIRKYIIKNYGLSAYKDGYQVFSTIDSSYQTAAREAVEEGIEDYEERHGFEKPENHEYLLPKSFKNRSEFFYAFAYDPFSYLDKFGIELEAKNPFYKAMEFLELQAEFKNFKPAILISVEDERLLTLNKEGKIENILLANLTKSIRPRINENRKDKKLTNFSEFFESGDLVWLSKDSNQNKSITLSIHPKVQSALVSLNPSSGEILALVGGYNFRNSQFNRAIQAKPQLGSNFKPFLYAAAFENGFSPASIIVDSPLVFDDQNLEEIWRPRNASGKFYGPTRLREALVQSRNVVSVKLLQEVSIKDAKESLEKFGFYKEELPNDLSLALGSYGASPLKNAELFSIFANGGKKVVPYFIDRIIFPDGNEINFSEEKKSKTGDYLSQWFGTDEREADNFSIDPRIAFMINDILKEAAQRGTGRKINELGRKDFAAKTGTSNDAESTWFTGFNENILTTVWFGYDNPTSLGNNEFGSTTSLPIWLNYKKQIIDTIPKGKFKKPSGLIARKINLETGELAKPEDERVKFELFLN
uniref:peptidoglycan glycosyltransferase n=1 Tax=uncultured proteobacterium RedeBAC7D11 TaxID=295350 RepID=Q5UF60_9PROT|nr:predicted penicillin-binding protein 1a [uncultured proteobacterium RedeBAC7D11]